MRTSLAWLALVLAGACRDPAPPAPITIASASAVSPDAAIVDAAIADAPAAPAMITDDECRRRGGRVITEQTYAYLNRRPNAHRTPFRACRIPSPRNGASCRGDDDCAGGQCLCTGALSRPDPEIDPALRAFDGTPATGRCSDEPLASGSWFCKVARGTVVLQALIID